MLKNVVPCFMNPPLKKKGMVFASTLSLPLFPFPAPVIWTLTSFHLHACFLSQGQPLTSGGTQASHCKPAVSSPAVKQEAAWDSQAFPCWEWRSSLVILDISPEDDMTFTSTTVKYFTDWILCRPEGACYLAVPWKASLFLLHNVTTFLHVD